MAKTLLRSGSLDAVLALGENGQPVYASAIQIRETLRLRRLHTLAACLAIPQADEKGQRLDWYAPGSGKVKSWHHASDSERRIALRQLEQLQQEARSVSLKAQTAENPALRLFGALLSNAFQFPASQYVYLVDGKPVITFWGFTDSQVSAGDDALEHLRSTLNEAGSAGLVLSSQPAAADEQAPAIAPQPALSPPHDPVTPVVTAADESAAQPAASKKISAVFRPRWWWVIPPAALVALVAAVTLLPPQSEKIARDTPPPQGKVTPPLPSAPSRNVTLPAVDGFIATLPLTPATLPASRGPDAARDAATATQSAEPNADKLSGNLVMTAEAVRIGSSAFLNGRWRAILQDNHLPGSQPPQLTYQFQNGKGSAQVIQGNGSRCKADVTAALMSSGNLSINSRYSARCNNGSRYRMPQLVCRLSNGATLCEAQFSKEQVFPITLRRESK